MPTHIQIDSVSGDTLCFILSDLRMHVNIQFLYHRLACGMQPCRQSFKQLLPVIFFITTLILQGYNLFKPLPVKSRNTIPFMIQHNQKRDIYYFRVFLQKFYEIKDMASFCLRRKFILQFLREATVILPGISVCLKNSILGLEVFIKQITQIAVYADKKSLTQEILVIKTLLTS